MGNLTNFSIPGTLYDQYKYDAARGWLACFDYGDQQGDILQTDLDTALKRIERDMDNADKGGFIYYIYFSPFEYIKQMLKTSIEMRDKEDNLDFDDSVELEFSEITMMSGRPDYEGFASLIHSLTRQIRSGNKPSLKELEDNLGLSYSRWGFVVNMSAEDAYRCNPVHNTNPEYQNLTICHIITIIESEYPHEIEDNVGFSFIVDWIRQESTEELLPAKGKKIPILHKNQIEYYDKMEIQPDTELMYYREKYLTTYSQKELYYKLQNNPDHHLKCLIIQFLDEKYLKKLMLHSQLRPLIVPLLKKNKQEQ